MTNKELIEIANMELRDQLEAKIIEADKLNDECYRLDRENTDLVFENNKLRKVLELCKRQLDASFPEIYRELLAKIDEVLNDKKA